METHFFSKKTFLFLALLTLSGFTAYRFVSASEVSSRFVDDFGALAVYGREDSENSHTILRGSPQKIANFSFQNRASTPRVIDKFVVSLHVAHPNREDIPRDAIANVSIVRSGVSLSATELIIDERVTEPNTILAVFSSPRIVIQPSDVVDIPVFVHIADDSAHSDLQMTAYLANGFMDGVGEAVTVSNGLTGEATHVSGVSDGWTTDAPTGGEFIVK